MQGYNPDFQARHHAVAQSSGTLHDRGSPCGSDDESAYLVYPDPHKIDPGIDDDSNAALTSQTLNADGTPKRPMNAFMIFARRRRPQVAAENQSMRTGEVSKILSREWNGMSLSDKQFYLDQAKLLKDNFNQKYPDYVYKRRPNNSRKRRKPEPAPGLSTDQASTSDIVDEHSGSADYSDVSPVDVADMDDARFSGQDVRYASLPAADPSGAPYTSTQSRASSYQPPDASYRPLGDTRVSYMSRPGRVTPDTGLASSISTTSRGTDHSAGYYYPYLSPQQQQQQQQHQHHHAAPSSSYFSESSSTGGVWSGARDDQGRVPWSQNSQDLSGDGRHRGYPHQPVSSHAWANTGTASEGIPSASSSGTSSAAAGFGLPTLTSPFYPPPQAPPPQNDSSNSNCGAQEGGGFSSSSIQPIPVSTQHYGAVAAPVPGNAVSGRSYASLQQAYSAGSPSAVGSYQSQARNISLTLPPGQHIPYPNMRPTGSPPPPAGSGVDPSQMRYWSRERSNT